MSHSNNRRQSVGGKKSKLHRRCSLRPNAVDESDGSGIKGITIAVRVRPLSQKEIESGIRSCCRVVGDSIVVIRRDGTGGSLKSEQTKTNEYGFDVAFPETSSQREVYEKTTKGYIPNLLAGLNVTVFCYGATGAGKTHTMLGNTRCDEAAMNAKAGIIPNAVHDLFKELNDKKTFTRQGEEWIVIVSFLEVYNEQVFDLLEPTGRDLPIREDQEKKVMVVQGLAEKTVESADVVMDLLRQGNANRKTEATKANSVSSRSHAALIITLRHSTTSATGSDSVVESKLSLIDLAGSERASATDNSGIRFKEGASINKSLLALANCINALACGGANGIGGGCVQYRDSKLTRLLKSSLEGNCNLVMIANVSPSHKTYEDSKNTLEYANRAKNIKVAPTMNETLSMSMSTSAFGWSGDQSIIKTGDVRAADRGEADQSALAEENKQLRQRVEELEKRLAEDRAAAASASAAAVASEADTAEVSSTNFHPSSTAHSASDSMMQPHLGAMTYADLYESYRQEDLFTDTSPMLEIDSSTCAVWSKSGSLNQRAAASSSSFSYSSSSSKSLVDCEGETSMVALDVTTDCSMLPLSDTQQVLSDSVFFSASEGAAPSPITQKHQRRAHDMGDTIASSVGASSLIPQLRLKSTASNSSKCGASALASSHGHSGMGLPSTAGEPTINSASAPHFAGPQTRKRRSSSIPALGPAPVAVKRVIYLDENELSQADISISNSEVSTGVHIASKVLSESKQGSKVPQRGSNRRFGTNISNVVGGPCLTSANLAVVSKPPIKTAAAPRGALVTSALEPEVLFNEPFMAPDDNRGGELAAGRKRSSSTAMRQQQMLDASALLDSIPGLEFVPSTFSSSSSTHCNAHSQADIGRKDSSLSLSYIQTVDPASEVSSCGIHQQHSSSLTLEDTAMLCGQDSTEHIIYSGESRAPMIVAPMIDRAPVAVTEAKPRKSLGMFSLISNKVSHFFGLGAAKTGAFEHEAAASGCDGADKRMSVESDGGCYSMEVA